MIKKQSKLKNKKIKTLNFLQQLSLKKLEEPFYLNIIRFDNSDKWYPVGYSKGAGSRNKKEAIALKEEGIKWSNHIYSRRKRKDNKNIKTVRIDFYNELSR